eukprot:351882-Chlamydomonas_euryale.AAC.21
MAAHCLCAEVQVQVHADVLPGECVRHSLPCGLLTPQSRKRVGKHGGHSRASALPDMLGRAQAS